MKILVPIDGSPLSHDALAHALGLIDAGLRAELVLANVQEPANLYELVTAPDPDTLDEVARGAGEHLLAPAMTQAQAAGVSIDQEVASGDPARMLIEIAERHGCALIVMGAHGKGAVRSALMGSVSQEVVRLSPVPVTLVKHPDEDNPADLLDELDGDGDGQ
jgi:nucleotide-binding universal stress UspA family protein